MKVRTIFLSALLIASILFTQLVLVTAADSLRYSPRIIIDPGHGGDDGGAVSLSGKKESEINLEIALRCELLAAFMGTCPIMTRYTEEIAYPDDAVTIRARKVWDQHSRAELANSIDNALFISIHQNKYTSSGPSGAQVFYNDAVSEPIAKSITEQFFKYVNADKKRTAKPVSEDIYLFHAAKCPALLIECGFLSNPAEAEKLESAEHQKLLSMIIIGSVCGSLNDPGGAK